MLTRILLLAAALGSEVLVASLTFDGAQIPESARGFLRVLRDWGAWGTRWSLAAAAIFAVFAILKPHRQISALGALLRPRWLVAHAVALTILATLTNAMYHGQPGVDSAVAGVSWVVLGLAVAISAAFAVMPPTAWLEWRRETGTLWLQAAAGATLACWLGALSRHLWEPATATTFQLVKALLSLVANQPVMEPARFLVGTKNFRVIISPECSGLEGMGLFLIFGLLWLILFRHEVRFPQAALLVPFGMVVLYLLNAIRITGIILIGHIGFKDIAARGFHSQAGWIFFCAVAFAMLLGFRRIPWIVREQQPVHTAEHYPALPYLAPFLAIVAAGILSQAMTGRFEWAYSLRLAAGVLALWIFRHQYRGINWRFGWLGVGAGTTVFLLWIATHKLLGSPPISIPPDFAAASEPLRLFWLIGRIVSAVITVPIAEELAFRGFGLRRLIAEHFDAVPWGTWTWTSFGISSIVFGLLHGALWPAGIAAGLFYGSVAVRRQRLGEAIGAHATTNALLAAYVLFTDRWELW